MNTNEIKQECHCSRHSRYHQPDSIYKNHGIDMCWTDIPKIKTMEERFDEQFGDNLLKLLSNGDLVAGKITQDIILSFIKSEIDLALENSKKEVVEMIIETDIPKSEGVDYELAQLRYREKIINRINK